VHGQCQRDPPTPAFTPRRRSCGAHETARDGAAICGAGYFVALAPTLPSPATSAPRLESQAAVRAGFW